MGDRNSAIAKRARKEKTPTQKELKRLQDRIRHQNKVKRSNSGGINNTRGDMSTKTTLLSPPSVSNNSTKTVTCTEVSADVNVHTMQSGGSQSSKGKFVDVHPNIHMDDSVISGSSAPILTATEGSLSNTMDDDSKKKHADSLDAKVSNNQFVEDSLPVILNAGSTGEGFPYAPENWPSPGDIWTWRVGTRHTQSGFWQDRGLHPPDHFRSSTGNKLAFYSKVSLEQYVRNTFPDADINAFFASFVWRIPCTDAGKEFCKAYVSPKTFKSNGSPKPAPAVGHGNCKASNKMCHKNAKTGSSLTPVTCDICCSEPNFCRNCCCILCSKTIDWAYEGYKFIKCEATVDEAFICGHVAHIECALRAYMAGKVGGSVDLDAQYYCRSCDNKTDLLSHVGKIIKVCESIDNRDDKEKALNLGLCMLRGSEKVKAKELWDHIAVLIEKLKDGVSLNDVRRKRGGTAEPEQGTVPMEESSVIYISSGESG